MVLLNPKWYTTKTLCIAWRTWSCVGPLKTYKRPSKYSKPFWNSNLACSMVIFWTWWWILNWPWMLIVTRSFFKFSQIWQIRVLSLGIINNAWNRKRSGLKMKSHCCSEATFPSLSTRYEWWNNALGLFCCHPRQYVKTNWNQNKDNAHQTWCWFKTRFVMKYCKFLWFEYTMNPCRVPSSKWHHSWKASTNVISFFIMNLVVNFQKRKLTRIEADKMKKIILSKLWEYDTYCKAKNIRFQNKRLILLSQ